MGNNICFSFDKTSKACKLAFLTFLEDPAVRFLEDPAVGQIEKQSTIDFEASTLIDKIC